MRWAGKMCSRTFKRMSMNWPSSRNWAHLNKRTSEWATIFTYLTRPVSDWNANLIHRLSDHHASKVTSHETVTVPEVACVAGVRRGRKGERRAREAREGRTREDHAHFDFPPFLHPAMQATPEPANFLMLFPSCSFQKVSSHPLPRGKTQFWQSFLKRKE